MKKVKPGSVQTILSFNKRKPDGYLIKCVKAVTKDSAILVTERPVLNTQNERQKLRARIIKANEGKPMAVHYTLSEIEGKVVALIFFPKPRK